MNRSIPYILIILIAIVFASPLFKNINNLGANDWDHFCFFDEAPRITISEYHQFPLWNPYSHGGRPLLADPQVGFLKPTFLFTLFFGCVIGLKLEILTMLILGMIGMYLLLSYYEVSVPAAILASSLFGLSSFLSLHIAEGHIWVLPFTYLPFIFLFYLKSIEVKKNIIFAAIFFALLHLAAGTVYAFATIVVFLGAYSIFLSVKLKKIIPVLNLVLILLLAAGFSAVRILPTIEYLGEHPRFVGSTEITPLDGMYEVLLNREQMLWKNHFPGQPWGWHEFGAYTGLLPLILFAAGLIFLWKKEQPLILSGFLALLVAFGDFASWAPWHILHKLPLFASTHVPSRFIGVFIFVLAVIVGLMVDALYNNLKHYPMRKILLCLVIILIITDVMYVNSRTFSQAFPNTPPNITRNATFTQIIDHDHWRSGSRSSMYLDLIANNGVLNGYNPVPHEVYAKAAEDKEYKGEVYITEGTGDAAYSFWSPNKLIVSVKTNDTARLVINQNYDSGWRIQGAKKTENFKGLLSTKLYQQDTRVTFYYLPLTFIVGALISLLSIFIVVWYSNQNRNMPKISKFLRKFIS